MNLDDITAIYIGTDVVVKLMWGAELVWEAPGS